MYNNASHKIEILQVSEPMVVTCKCQVVWVKDSPISITVRIIWLLQVTGAVMLKFSETMVCMHPCCCR